MQPLRQRVHQQSRGNTDIEALCEAVHRYLHIHVGMFKRIVGETGFFRTEHHGDRLVEWESVKGVVVLVRTCRDYLIAFAMQKIKGFRCVELVDVVFVEVEPFAAADNNIRIDVVNPFVFDNVYVLNTCQVTASQHRARVVRLINVFKHYCEVTSPVIQHLLEALFPFFRYVIGEKFV